ncbi:MAG: helix-turn-helix domain-containing protein [Mycobacteriales bacterium]
MDKVLLTVKEAATALGISRSKLYELLAAGTLPSLRIDRCRRIPARAVIEFGEPTPAQPARRSN